MKTLLFAPIFFIFLSPINAEDNPFATKPRYGHDPFYREYSPKKKLIIIIKNKKELIIMLSKMVN